MVCHSYVLVLFLKPSPRWPSGFLKLLSPERWYTCVCPQAIKHYSGVMNHSSKFCFYMALAINNIDGRGLSNEACHVNCCQRRAG